MAEMDEDDNLQGVGHPILPGFNNDDDEDSFNDMEEITDETLDPDKEGIAYLEVVGHPIEDNLPNVTEESNLPE